MYFFVCFVDIAKSPIVSIVPFNHPEFSSSFLVSTDTETSFVSLFSSPFNTQIHRNNEEEEEPDVVRMNEQLEEAEDWMLEGVQSDYSRCSYEQFGACRQQVFVCRTCRDQYDRLLHIHYPNWTEQQIQSTYDVGVVCEQCAHFCHTLRGHDVVALGVKNNFKCDCGNNLFRRLDLLGQEGVPLDEIPELHACSLHAAKDSNNFNNQYNHNMRERYCYCDGEESLPMVQCVRCCDWFHNSCAIKRYAEIHEGRILNLEDESIDFVCAGCEGRQEEMIISQPVSNTKEEVEEDVVEEEEEEERLARLIRVPV